MKNNDGKYFLKAKEVVNIYDQLVVELFENMIKRLKARGNQDLIDNPYIWQLEKLNDMHLLTEANVKLIAKRSGIAEDIFRDVIANEGFKIYKDLHEQLQNDLGIEQEINYKVQQSLNALVDQTMFDINNLLNTTLPNRVQSMYKNIVEQISASVIAGTKSQDKAISEAIMQSFENGFTGFRDKAGRNWRADSYIRTIINTTTRRVFREMREQSAEDLGIDTFYYSFKAAAREMCLPIQHRIVTKGVTRKINGETVYSLSDYGYGTPAGCLGINCGHYLTPFVVGVNKKPDLPEHLAKLTDEDILNNAKAQARQRAFEREIRKSKEKIYLAKALEDKELIQKHTLRLKSLKGGLKKLIEDNPFLYRDYTRERNHFIVAKNYNNGYNIIMKRRKNINQDKMSVASKEQINKLSRKFRRRGGQFIGDEDAIHYLNERNAEAVTLNGNTIIWRKKISISALIEELEHTEQYLRKENDGSPLSVVRNEIAAKRKSIENAKKYKLPRVEVEAVKSEIKRYEMELRRLLENENN